MLQPNSSALAAVLVANALRTAVADAVFTGMAHQVTVSIGISGYPTSASQASASQDAKTDHSNKPQKTCLT